MGLERVRGSGDLGSESEDGFAVLESSEDVGKEVGLFDRDRGHSKDLGGQGGERAGLAEFKASNG